MSVAAARGFRAAGWHCGVKADGVPGLAWSAADDRASAASVFTTSTTAAPVVEMGRAATADGFLRAPVGRVARWVGLVFGFSVVVGLASVGWLS